MCEFENTYPTTNYSTQSRCVLIGAVGGWVGGGRRGSIVGKGNHSDGGVQRIKPAVETLCRELNLQFSTEQNAGRMYISLVPVDGEQAGEVPAGNHPRPLSILSDHHRGYHAYAGQPQQPQHVFSGESGAALPGLQTSSLGGFGSSAFGQQQQHYKQEGHHPDLSNDSVPKEAFFKKLVSCCVVM